jgi:GntR family transcriptional regulator/MocR family aminotransferase
MLGQAALARFIETGAFGRHVKKMSGVYRTRHRLIAETLRRDFADELELVPSEAGLHLAALARKASVAGIKEVLHRAMDAGVAFQALARFAIDGPPRPGIILGYGAIPTHLVRAGLRRLRECFR